MLENAKNKQMLSIVLTSMHQLGSMDKISFPLHGSISNVFLSSLILQCSKLFNVIIKIQNPGCFFFCKMTKIITFQRAGSTLHVMDQVEVYLKIYIMLLIAGRFELFLDIYRTQIFLTIFLFIIFSMQRRGNLSSYISSRRKITLT